MSYVHVLGILIMSFVLFQALAVTKLGLSSKDMFLTALLRATVFSIGYLLLNN